MTIALDYYGMVIVPGVRVAYNYMGEVRIGRVESVKNVARNGRLNRTWSPFEPYLEIRVQQDNGKISKVTNRLNLVVI